MKFQRPAVLLLFVGLLQITGDVLGSPVLKGLGASWAASPAPRVFSATHGLETFSTLFALEWSERDGRQHALALTPAVYGRLHGPYNRRNVYGAALAYGPVLATDPRSQPMLRAVLSHAFCGETPLLRELGIDATIIEGSSRIRFRPIPGTAAGLPRTITAPCS